MVQATYISKNERSVPGKDGKPGRTFYNVTLDFPGAGAGQVGVDDLTYRMLDKVQKYTEVTVDLNVRIWNGRAEFGVAGMAPVAVGKGG